MVVKSSILLVKPHAHDVLLGSSNVIIKHIGTVFYRRLIERFRTEHLNNSLSKNGKTAAQEVFDEVKTLDPPGRFLLATSNDFKEWYEVSNQKAMEKIRAALSDTGNQEQQQQQLPALNNNIVVNKPKQVQSSNPRRSCIPKSLTPPALSSFESFQESVVNVPSIPSNNNANYTMRQAKGGSPRIHAANGPSNGSNGNDNNSVASSSLKSRNKYQLPNEQISADIAVSRTEQLSRDSSATTKCDNVHPEEHIPEKASFKSNLISISDNESGISSITKETNASLIDSFSRNFFANAMNNTKGSRKDVALPTIADSYESLLSMNDNNAPPRSSSNSVCSRGTASIASSKKVRYSNCDESDSDSSSDSSRDKMRRKKRKASEYFSSSDKYRKESKRSSKGTASTASSSTKTTSTPRTSPKTSFKAAASYSKRDNFHMQVMMPVSYIGQSFSNSKGCSEETKQIFEDIANLGQMEDNATLFLPGIIGSLCQRIVELEKDHNLSDGS